MAGAALRGSARHNLPGRAAEVSFYFLLEIVPLLLFASALLGYVFAAEHDSSALLLEYLVQTIPAEGGHLVRTLVNEITTKTSGGKLSFGLALALWSGSSAVVAIIEGLNVAYEISEQGPWWRRKLIAMILTLVMGVLALVATALIFAGEALVGFVASLLRGDSAVGAGSKFAGGAIAVCSMLVGLMLIYRFGPNLKSRGVEAVLPGAIVGVIGWLVVSLGFRKYLEVLGTVSRVYGSLTEVIVLLVWLYLSAASILFGGEVNAAIRARAGGMSPSHARPPT